MVLLEYMLEEGGFAPVYAHCDDACFDLRTPVDFILYPGQRKTIPLQIRFFVENGFYLAIFPRSGLARDAGISIVNTPGTIDAGYTGIVGVTLINTDLGVPKQFRRGDKVCQGCLKKKEEVELRHVFEKPVTLRGMVGLVALDYEDELKGIIRYVDVDNERRLTMKMTAFIKDEVMKGKCQLTLKIRGKVVIQRIFDDPMNVSMFNSTIDDYNSRFGGRSRGANSI